MLDFPIEGDSDWELLEKYAQYIRTFSQADPWDEYDSNKKDEYLQKEKNFKEAMEYLIKNWHSFWW